jgi:tetratricopeptide (TPR) repeat protein
MSLASQTCAHCQFDNPRAFRACAACGMPLGSAPRRSGRFLEQGGRVQSERTVVTHAVRPGEAELPEEGEELLEDDLDSQPPPPEDVEPPLVGREEISAILRTAIETSQSKGTATLVALEGDAGSGRTRLLFHAAELAARSNPSTRILFGACREGDGVNAPFTRILLERFGVTPSSSPSVVRAQIAMFVSEGLGVADALTVGETTHLLGHLAGVPFPDSPFLAGLDEQPAELRRRQCAALKRFFEGDAQKRPTLLLLDQMHAADDGAWGLVEVIASCEAPITIVLAGEPPVIERAGRIEAKGGSAVGPIGPLTEADVASMLHVLLPALAEASEPLVAALTHRSRGNPSALRELVFALLEAGLFLESERGLVPDVARLDGGGLPVSLEDAIRARLARLDELERATIDRAAVLGQVVVDRALLAMMRTERAPAETPSDPLALWPADDDVTALEHALARLQEKGFLEPLEASFPGVRELRFVHQETERFVYAQLDEAIRVRRHRTVAHWITTSLDVDRPGVAALAVPHLEKGGMPERAGRAHLLAAKQELALAHTQQALRHAERALELLPPSELSRRLDALHVQGSLLSTLGRYDEALAAFSSVLGAAFTYGARGKGGAALNRIARVYRARGEDERARQGLLRALELFRAAGDVRGVAASLDDLAQIETLRGDLEAAAQAAGEALHLRREAGDVRGEAVSLTNVGRIQHARGELEAAAQDFQMALEIRQRVGDRQGVAESLNAVALIAYERGQTEAAESAWRDALAEARAIGDRRTQTFILNNMGESLSSEGRNEEARVFLLEARAHAHESGDKRMMAEVERNLGLIALRLDEDDADTVLGRALAYATEYGAKGAIAHANHAIGLLRSKTIFDGSGAADRRAEEAYLLAIDGFREIGNEKEAARVLADLGRNLVERGDLETAKERLREARAIMRRIGLPEIEKVDATLAQLG